MTPEARAAWLVERRSCVTATDVRRLVVPYEDDDPPQAALIFDEKRGTAPERTASPLMAIGLATEDVNAGLYERASGRAVYRPAAPLTRHPSQPWAGASLDREHVDDGSPVELKYTPFFSDAWGDAGTDHVPLGYVVQTTWQLFVTGRDLVPVSVLTGAGHHRVYRVELVAQLAAVLADIARDFWHFVELGQRPADDWVHPAVRVVADELSPVVRGKAVELGPEAWKWAKVYKESKAVEAQAKFAADGARDELLALMGDAEKATAGRDYKLSRAAVAGAEVSYYRKPSIRLTVTEVKEKGHGHGRTRHR